jgi:steroid delta-isomerase
VIPEATDQLLDPSFPGDDDHSARAASLRSRAAVQAGDRERWVALFTDDGLVADPVGPSMFDPDGNGHVGHAAIGAFFDAAIADNSVRMDLHSSHAGLDECANVVTVVTTLPDGSQASVDIVAVYRVADDGRIRSMKAYWEMDDLRFTAAPSPAD